MKVGTLLGPGLADLKAALQELDPLADAFEIRLDSLPETVMPETLRSLTTKPLIATCRRPKDGGAFRGDETARVALLRACLEAGFDSIDVEDGVDAGIPGPKTVRSRHEMHGTPAPATIVRRCQEMAAAGATAKYASATNGAHDVTAILVAARTLQRAKTPAAVMGLGPMPRSLLLLCGAPLVFGGGTHRPAGQPTLAEIVRLHEHWGSPPPADDLYLVLGDPVDHSLSPRMHNAGFQAQRLSASYGALPLSRGADLQTFLENADDLRLLGASVTSPLKDAAYDLVGRRTKEAEDAHAANCLRNQDGVLEAHNTDGAGAHAVLRRLLSGASGKVLVLGTGGAARALAAARGGFDVTVAGRTPQTLARVGRELGVETIPIAQAGMRLSGFDAVVNATGDPDPLRLQSFHGAIFDFRYRDGPTEWQRSAEQAKAAFAGGRELLLEQGVLSYSYWTGREAPRKAMAAALGLGA